MDMDFTNLIHVNLYSACPECQFPPAVHGTEKASLPAGRPDIEGGFGKPDSAGEAVEKAGAPMMCSLMVCSRAGNTAT